MELEYEGFYQLCTIIENIFEEEWRDTDELVKGKKLEREKRAIMGFEKETRFYKDRIREILSERGYEGVEFPPWYRSLAEGIFHQVYGLAGLAPWAYDETQEYEKSSSAKLIGDKLFCLIDGKAKLQPQRIDSKRREQLKRTLLMASPRERLESGFHEVYLHNGIRITIFSGERTKKDQDVMVFRKYVLKELTFEKLAELRTIPREAVPLFKTMIAIGFNVIFAGQVRSGKTTFMQTWQSYEDKSLEGLAIATDPETPWHEIMADAPIIQLIADGKELESIGKSLVRGDNDYVLLEEMRDGTAYRLALEITSIGTSRCKATIHDSSSVNIPYKMASKIKERYGGDLRSMISQVYMNFNYVFELYQSPEDRGVKKLKSISEYRYDAARDEVSVHEICRYDMAENVWTWRCDIGEDKRRVYGEYRKDLEKMEEQLKNLEMRYPMVGNSVIYPRYYQPAEMAEGKPRC